jgi:hypothetical protein
MPRSAKPRRRRGFPLQLKRGAAARPLPHEVDLVFRPIDAMFEQLRNDQVDAVRGRLVFVSFEGELCEICPALEGWIKVWELLDRRFELGIPTQPLDVLRRKLDAGMPLELTEVDAAWQTICAQRRAYAWRLDMFEVKSVVRTAEIKLALEEKS